MLAVCRSLTCCIAVVLGALGAHGQPVPVVFDQPPPPVGHWSIGERTLYTDDLSLTLPLSEIKSKTFTPLSSRKNEREEGLDQSVMVTWLQFAIHNQTADTLRLVWSCNVQYSVEVFLHDVPLVRYGLFDRTVKIVYPTLRVPPGAQHHYWVKVTNYYQSIMPMVSELYTEQAALAAIVADHNRTLPLLTVLAIMTGCFVFMMVFAFYHYYLNRDRAFLYYGLSLMLLTHQSLLAISNRFGAFGLTDVSLLFTYIIFYALFIDQMIGIRTRHRLGWKVIKVLMVVCGVFQVYILLETLLLRAPLLNVTFLYHDQLVPVILLAATCLGAVLRSQSPLKTYLATGITAMVAIGFVPLILSPYFRVENAVLEAFVNFPPFYMYVGMTVENICFAMALAYRSRQAEKDKNALQQRYAAQLETELTVRTKAFERKSQELEEQKIQKLTVEFEQQLQATEMTALRAQMNPHFIFNCLNSIKLYTLENDAANAAEYLTKFSRLIRLVLENSQYEKIPLSTELETLQLYIAMETMRFKNKFGFTLNVSQQIDAEYVEVPSMLIQPYIENAIWHGLMHKEQAGTLVVFIDYANENTLRVAITDDGVGRERAAEYKSKSATRQKSFGLKATSERIALINQRNNADTIVQIEDLVYADGSAAGTKVVITIPV